MQAEDAIAVDMREDDKQPVSIGNALALFISLSDFDRSE